MIAREPLKRDPNAGRKPERAVLRNPGARGGRVPVIAILAPALERRTVGLRELLSGESLFGDDSQHIGPPARERERRRAGRRPRRHGRGDRVPVDVCAGVGVRRGPRGP
jgi:hypothetical protein